MNLTSPTQVRQALAEIDVRPSKALGQNFLIDRNVLEIMLDAADLHPDSRVLEIGPGLGVLTSEMLDRAEHVIAVEKDHKLAGHLRRFFEDRDSLKLHEADALEMDLPGLIRESGVTRMISNLPYLVGTRILMNLFMGRADVPRMAVTLQKDVGARLIAEPGTAEYGLLSIWAQLDYEVKVRKIIKPTCFYPVPGVDSAIIVFSLREKPRAEIANREAFGRLVKYAFSQRRKQIQSLLAHAPKEFRVGKDAVQARLEPLGIDPKDRPEAISLERWAGLSNLLHNTGNDGALPSR